VIRRIVKKALRTFGVAMLPPLNEDLTKLERVVRLPPLTRELVAAIKLIAPQYDLTTSEKSRVFWETETNGSCWGEYEALAPLFNSMKRPARILELGPGLGRSLVFFSKKLGWQDSEIHAYEGDGSSTKYTVLGPRFDDSFCSNVAMMRRILQFNGIDNVKIFDAHSTPLAALPGPYDFIYSFYSIGFHWSLEHFLDDLTPLMSGNSVAVFMVPAEFAPFPKLKGLHYELLETRTVWPKDRKLKLLILRSALIAHPDTKSLVP
jgi:hypothetical protein